MSDDRTSHCLFCRILDGSLPAEQVYSDEHVVAFHDIHPQAPTHILVIPRRHIAGIASPDAENGAILQALIQTANRIAREQGVADSGYRMVFNWGPNAGQSVFHLHLHLLGGRPLAWPPG